MAVKLDLKNKIINGCFDFWQRGTSFVSAAAGDYSADRWQYSKAGTVVHSIARSTDPLPSSAFGNYSVFLNVTTANIAPTSTDFCELRQQIEGNILRTIKDRKLVLKFLVKSSKTGTFCVAFKNGDGTRSLVKEYTIDVANTWEAKTIRFTHESTGTWLYDTGVGMRVVWTLGAGSSFITSPDIWQSGNYNATINQVNVMDAISNEFRLADVVLVEDNEGQTREPEFMYAGRDYFEELQLCQRYYEKSYDLDSPPGTITGSNTPGFPIAGTTLQHAKRCYTVYYKVRKRVPGDARPWGPYSGVIDRIGVQAVATDYAANSGGSSEAFVVIVKNGSQAATEGDGVLFHYTCDAEL